MRHKRPRSFGTADDLYSMPDDDVLRAIGRVAVVSASIEDIIHFIYWRYVDTTWEIAPILTTGEKPSRLTEDILKMAIAVDEDPGRIQDLRDLFADFRELNEKRNKCIHWLWHWPKGKNKFKHELVPPFHQSTRKPVGFTVKQINALADDLAWVEQRMHMHALSEEDFEEKRAMTGRRWSKIVAPAPWLDKPLKPNPKRLPRPATQKRQKRPPLTSKA